MNRGPLIAIGVCLIVIAAMVRYIGLELLPQIFTDFWSILLLGGAITAIALLLVWDALFRQQAKQYVKKVQAELASERDAVDRVRLHNTEMLRTAALKEERAERHEQAALKYRAEAEARIEDAERRRTNAMGAARRRQRKIEKLEARH